MEVLMAVKRNRRKQTVSFDERLQKAAQQAREAARNLPLGPQRESMLRKAEQAETAARISEWLSSPVLHSSK